MSTCFSKEIVFVVSPAGSQVEERELQIATAFYGLDLRTVSVGSRGDAQTVRDLASREETAGVAIAANALTSVDESALLGVLARRKGRIPLLILGVSPDQDSAVLMKWSDGTLSGARKLIGQAQRQYLFGKADGLTFQLSNLAIPIATKDLTYLLPNKDNSVSDILSVQQGNQKFSVFQKMMIYGQQMFVASAMPAEELLTSDERVVNEFLCVAPPMIFVHYSAGEHGWHTLYHYANFTIDDPWLRQPYGYVDYESLLDQMQRHNFHTTIAFIPWNYARSQPRVVSLFREHPDRFSIAIHGDNHDHKEFTDYRSRCFALQVKNLKQSLARMEKFRALTGIDYDQVMVFPHSIPPEKTLVALKTYNYLATVNSNNVPQDKSEPSSPLFFLRPMTLRFGGFPSIIRYSITGRVSHAFVAISGFLGNPLFFYGHSDDLSKGVGAFNGIAEEVNRIEPDTEWRSLGESLKHLYLARVRDDSNYDVMAFANEICLDGAAGRNTKFVVRKREFGSQVIKSVTLDGEPYPYQIRNGYFMTNVSVLSGASRCISIRYDNDLNLAKIDISHDSLMIQLLRRMSDFRDIYLAKTSPGDALIRFYYGHELTMAELVETVIIMAFITVCAGFLLRRFFLRRRTL